MGVKLILAMPGFKIISTNSRVSKGISPQASHTTVREPLD